MTCPNCKNDRILFPRAPQRFSAHDERIGECTQCRFQLRVRSVVEAVMVFNPVNEEAEWIAIDKFKADGYGEVVRGLKQHPAQVSFNREHGHG